MTIKNVNLGDMFIDPRNRKSKRISTVTGFVERKNMVTGEVVGYECWASHEFMGQTIRFEVAFATVLINKVATTNQI